ncbi:interleukin-6-like [Parambassis ranga]|uniref:Interleukin-6 n=1 Tax=Parambassis ranga TaxID=210632 RepID=A0A6P7HZ82_9TELE|nr:interleukin-6-like [Parambassis ranga]
MASKFSSHFLPAAVLVVLLMLGASGVPLQDTTTESPAGDTSGEEEGEKTSDLLSNSKVLRCLLRTLQSHKEEFAKEFPEDVAILDHDSSSFPKKCPDSNFSKEACFQRLAQGLLKYTVLLRHAEREYPSKPYVSVAKSYSGYLIEEIKQKMKNRALVVPLTSSQEEHLLKDFDGLDDYNRKIAARRILHHLHLFLIDGKRSICRREQPRGAVICRTLGTATC